ncbi:hypothetical protein EJ08DRAFT_738285 [Tothia fuscella]|uniref:DNA endonuclease activator Ctp1 C-terminal domain-containing protein n=1 Tax=Tothia fuscella TaxID=1048955 RepID=A0A9P4NH82_9PEZI|nr:hypothetical protein EJ08DRAFT_738285 [Tothia fuscella]
MEATNDAAGMLQQLAASNAVFENYVKSSEQQISEKDKLIRHLLKKNEEQKLENEVLHGKLADALNSRSTPANDEISSTPGRAKANDANSSQIASRVTIQKATIPAKDYQDLVHKYCSDIKAHETAHEKLLAKCYKMKATCKNWQTWCDRQLHKQQLKSNKIQELETENDQLRRVLRDRAIQVSRPSTARSSSVAVPQPGEDLPSSPPRPRNEPAAHGELEDRTADGSKPLEQHELSNADRAIASSATEGAPAGRIQEVTTIIPPVIPYQVAETLLHEDGPNSGHVQAPSKDAAQSEEPSSSQTTGSCNLEGEDRNNVRTDVSAVVDDLNDLPIVISARSTSKRKRGASSAQSTTPAARGAGRNGSPEQPIVIKDEHFSSPAKHTTNRFLTRTETLDLDDVGDKIDTPRKRRRINQLHRNNSLRTAAMDDLRLQRSTSLPREQDLHRHLSNEHLPLRDDEENIDPLYFAPIRRADSDPSMLLEESANRALSEPSHSFMVKDELQDDHTPSRNYPRPLQPLDTNQRILPRIGASSRVRAGKGSGLSRGAKALHLLAEDGNFLPPKSSPVDPELRKRADMRLQELLEQTEPEAEIPLPKSRITAKAAAPKVATPAPRRKALSKETPTSGMLPTPESMAPKSRPEFNAPPPLRTSNVQTPRNIKALRDRPIAALRLSDFKPNVKKYPAMDATVAEQSRSREARSHMEGCTSSNCPQCGDSLRHLASTLNITLPTPLFASPEEATYTNDERFVKLYLGNAFNREQFSWMNRDDRNRLVTKAKEKYIADNYVKHRVNPNRRAKSPPGFWDIDMAGTQEVERQREEVDRMDREIIAERYREAMKGGGRWLFKDEA